MEACLGTVADCRASGLGYSPPTAERRVQGVFKTRRLPMSVKTESTGYPAPAIGLPGFGFWAFLDSSGRPGRRPKSSSKFVFFF